MSYRQEVTLWGSHKPRDFLQVTLRLALYHDLEAVGYCRLTHFRDLPCLINHKSLYRNVTVLRRYMGQWAHSHIQEGSLHEWRAAARYAGFPKLVNDVTLLIDSVDLRIENEKNNLRKKSDFWSWKKNGPGQRCTVIFIDAKRRVRYLSALYSPKVYDGHFITSHKRELEEKFEGGVFAADGHYGAGRQFKKAKFRVPSRELSNKDDSEDEAQDEGVSEHQKKLNRSIRSARERVETTFELITQTWKLLARPWAEDCDQLAHVVAVVVAVYNKHLA